MLISTDSVEKLKKDINDSGEAFCSGLFLSARWFVVSEYSHEGIQVIILPDKDSAEYCAADLYNLIEGDNVFFLPDSGKSLERSNYKASLMVQRTSAVGKIIEGGPGMKIIVTYPAALEEGIPDTLSIRNSVLKLSVGEEIGREDLVSFLFENGFERVDFVSEPGQFAVRGAIVDIFSYSYNDPFRISFFGDEIDSINIFDCNSQLSKANADSVDIYPDITSEDSEGQNVSICSILPEDTLIWLDSSDMYKEKTFFNELDGFRRIFTDVPLSRQDVDSVRFSITPQPSFNKNFELLTEDIRSRLEQGYRVRIYGDKESQLDRLKSILNQSGGILPEFISRCNIHNGFIDNENKVCCYSDHEIFNRFHRVNIRRSVDKSEQLTINDLTSFAIGDYIVHIDYGVGIFGGLVRMKDDKGRMHEVVKLTYKDNDVVFVSVHALHKISRYKSKDSEPPKIHKLGSRAWQNLKSSTKSKVKDIAKDLIQLYAKRKSSKGFAFSADTYLQQELESSFMYEDTPDQEKAVYAVKRDMEDDCPMDRLVCGDVGFGKTEVAVRAAFKAVADSKQVAVLVPTTILSLQHYNTFKKRLADLPCNIDYVSRLRTAKEISDIQKRLKAGTLDIVIGTHKLIGKGFEFKDLGLLIIDEEQKFGVGAKEKLRQLKASVDTLTLTATPIPRTLQFSLLGARDLSIINTPPPNRIPVQTEIMLFDHDEIKKIINYELNRGGQLFFVHNRVEELQSVYDILHRLVPDMKICMAHGQMESKVLENKILDFMAGDYDMLLCTTIIENGLDIPNANTIIINQAQNIGLSDLHQLRGRVGRSNRRAFCYLIVPPLTSITDEARRRLKAIESFSDLGSGFNIAMQDLDIRGAGNLLGAEQSGFITDMGFETYQKILAEAMEELGMETGIVTRSTNEGFTVDCTIETDQIALIPDTYIDMTAEKIRIYKELDSLQSDKEINSFKEKLTDRFGKMPEELERLFDIVRIRQLGERLGFEKIIIKNGVLIAFFISNPLSQYYRTNVFSRILENVSLNPKLFELKQNDNRLRVFSRNVDGISRAYEILKKLQ
ncbi:MAG: transcription-repair coupling factor [Bacteroidales bacterium]|nr:transcription-repair coupling factor [Bacteroidales bacterium]